MRASVPVQSDAELDEGIGQLIDVFFGAATRSRQSEQRSGGVAVDAGGGDSGRLDFLDYGKAVEVPVPPAAETIDVTKLGK